MYEYELELFFYHNDAPADIREKGLQISPELSHYSKQTKNITLCTWEDFRNSVLVDYPDVAYILIHVKKAIMPLDEYISQFETDKLEVKDSEIHGFGVFSKTSIIAGETLMLLEGDLVNISAFKGGYPKGEWNAISDTVYLVRSQRTLYGFLNHSLCPNAEIKMGELVVKSSMDIESGEEITIDYTKEKLSESYLNGHGKTYLFK